MMIPALFTSIDTKNIKAFTDFLAEDAIFCFGNVPQVQGKANIANAVTGFLHSVADIEHQLTAFWQLDNTVICHGTVTYTRPNNTRLTVPFANILQLTAGKISEYRIFADISEL